MPTNFESAKSLLETTFQQSETNFLGNSIPNVDSQFAHSCDSIFSSNTQAYREVLLGCLVARIQDNSVDIRKPYINQGEHAFNGRTLDERVINPFLRNKRVPCSRGPYLSAFRRSVQFIPATRQGLRDRSGYDELLKAINRARAITSNNQLLDCLKYVLFRFIQLREASNIGLSNLQRVSLEQYDTLITNLLATPSQGRFPVILLVATFKTIGAYFERNWTVEFQGINEADAATGAGGDISIKQNNQTLLVAEVTERPVDISRVVATFQTKIAPQGIEDYLFFIKPSGASLEVRQQAHQYFAQGHEVNFLEIKVWILMMLATMGRKGRQIFNQHVIEILGAADVPRTIKVAWNNQIENLTVPRS